jgi:hypothetical protein
MPRGIIGALARIRGWKNLVSWTTCRLHLLHAPERGIRGNCGAQPIKDKRHFSPQIPVPV